MSKQPYDILAWCDRTYYAQISVEADSPEEALRQGRDRVHDADGVECDNDWGWDRFRVEDASGNTVLEHQEEHIRLRIAAGMMLAALNLLMPYAEAEVESLRKCNKRDGGIEAEVAKGERALALATAAIAEATGRAA